jgi:hypothetical protein
LKPETRNLKPEEGGEPTGRRFSSGFRFRVSGLSDLVNPIVVKELRQAVRGRFVVTLLILSLLAQMMPNGWPSAARSSRSSTTC